MELSPEEKYAWEHVPKDLAIMTHLTITEALDICRPLQELKLNPYDAYSILKRLVGAYKDDRYVVVGDTLAALVMLLDSDHRLEEIRKVRDKWEETRFYDVAAMNLRNSFVRDLEKIC